MNFAGTTPHGAVAKTTFLPFIDTFLMSLPASDVRKLRI